MPQKYLEQVRLPDQTVNPLFAFLGMEVVELTPDCAVLCLTVKPELIQGAGKAAGGILAALLDETMAHAVLGGNAPGQQATTVDMNVSYYRPANRDDVLTCKAHVVKRGSRIVFSEATVRCEMHDVAHATASFMLL